MIDSSTRTRFHSEYHLETWYPEGDLDGEMALAIAKFVGFEESKAEHSFDRFSDLSKLTGIHLDFIEIVGLAAMRRESYGAGPPVKSAILAPSKAAFGVARMFAVLMEPSPITVRIFRTIEEAGKWLGVPVEELRTETQDGLPLDPKVKPIY
jgi:hypothetical protein